MTEKAKMIIHSVGVFLTGAVFSMALMGIVGCHVQNAYSEEASSLRQKRQAKGTTENGGYEKYTFEVPLTFTEGKANATLYSFNTSTWTPSFLEALPEGSPSNRFEVASYYNSAYDSVWDERKTDEAIYLLVGSANTHFWNASSYTWTAYFSFIVGLHSQNSNQPTQTFICTTNTTYYSYPLEGDLSNWGFTTNSTNRNILISYNKSDVFFQWNETLPTTTTFQDIASYYLEQGYSDGETAGHADGYQQGYEDGTEGTMLFTDIGANQTRWYRADLSATDSTDTTTTYKLLTYRDGNNQAHSIYALEYVSDNSFLVVDYAGTSASSQYARTTLGKGTMTFSQSGAYVDVVPVNYIHYDFAQITGVFNNSIPLNYFMISGLPENATGYQQGYNKGYQDALSSSASGVALDNVFGLFSKAFGSVASFFNLKVFGFLPLYWFFLVPIFIAIITLLLRMVKH